MPASADEVISFLRSTDIELPVELTPETPLLRSGLVDSLGLFSLLEWVEQELGGPVDVLALDLPGDWDTPQAVAAFIERGGGR